MTPTGCSGAGAGVGANNRRGTSARGERTRQRILDAAEQLWSERGVDGVSLREIRIVAGQRNSSAMQFHFGDRDGLLLAVAQRHMPRVAALQEDLYAELVATGRAGDLAGLVEVLVRPDAEYLNRGSSERAWIRISAERFASPSITLGDITAHAPPLAVEVGNQIYEQLTQLLDPDVALERLLSVLVAIRHLCADRARLEEMAPGGASRSGLSFDRWLGNLLDMAVAALTAPQRGMTEMGRINGNTQ